MRTRIIVVDDHPLIRVGLRMMISSKSDLYEFVGEAASGRQLLTLLQSGVEADVILLDILMDDMSGIETARILKRDYPKMAILILSSESGFETIIELAKIGIDGYISKKYTNSELYRAIDNVAAGYDYFGNDIWQVMRDIRISKDNISDAVFTERELEIIHLCGEGLRTKEIAERLCLSDRTVSNHKQNIFAKMGINSKYEMVKYAVTKGILTIN